MISELQRYRLDKEILRIDIESSDLSGTIADRRRAISKARNEKFLKVNIHILSHTLANNKFSI